MVSRGRIVRNPKGEPIRIVGAIGDMTDRLEAAAKLAATGKVAKKLRRESAAGPQLFINPMVACRLIVTPNWDRQRKAFTVLRGRGVTPSLEL